MKLRERWRKIVEVLELGYARQSITEMYAGGYIDCKEYLKRIRELDENHDSLE